MKRSQIKPAITVGAIVLLIIVINQYLDTTETRILFFTVSMPRAVLLFLFAALGFAIGPYHVAYGKKRRDASRDNDNPEPCRKDGASSFLLEKGINCDSYKNIEYEFLSERPIAHHRLAVWRARIQT